MTSLHGIGLNVRWGVRLGLVFALVYSVIATVMLLLQPPDASTGTMRQLLLVVATYIAGGVSAGTVVGLLRPFTKRRIGAIAVGIVAAVPVFFGVAVAISGGISEIGPDSKFSVVLCSVTLGAFAGNHMWQQARPG